MRIAAHNLALLSILLLSAAVPASAAQRRLLAHASDSQYWVAQVIPDKEAAKPQDQTILKYRPLGSGNAWSPMPSTLTPSIATASVSLASLDEELVAVLDTGEWEMLSPTDSRLGTSCPAHGQFIAAANDDRSLWMVAKISGGTAGLTAPSATQPQTTQPQTAPLAASTTQPSTMAITLPTSLVVLRYDRGKWVQPVDLPDGVPVDASLISMAIVQHHPAIAYVRDDQSIRIIVLNDANRWQDLGVVKPTGTFDNMRLLVPIQSPILWVAAGGPGGVVYKGSGFSQKIDLSINGTIQTVDARTAVIAGERLRVLFSGNGNTYEQAFEISGEPVGALTELADAKSNDQAVDSWWRFALAVALVVMTVAMIRRRSAVQTAPPAGPRPLQLAPLGLRFAAGAIDALPVLIAAAILAREGSPTTMADAGRMTIPLAIATGFYLLHTFICELIWRMTLGKFLFGLQVVSLDGNPPRRGQIAMRNLLRIIDVAMFFPLAYVLISPLRQRLGDFAAGTVVVSTHAPDETGDEDDSGL